LTLHLLLGAGLSSTLDFREKSAEDVALSLSSLQGLKTLAHAGDAEDIKGAAVRSGGSVLTQSRRKCDSAVTRDARSVIADSTSTKLTCALSGTG
jgi:hypothetical protein